MPSFSTRLADGWQRAQSHLPLALIPLVTALSSTDKIRKVLAADGVNFGFRFGFPGTVVDLWQFVSVPNSGFNVDTGLGGLDSTFGLAAVVLAVLVRAGLAAGYFGSIHEALDTESYDFLSNVRRYFPQFLLYTLVPFLFLLPLVPLEGRGELRTLLPLFVVLVPVIFLVTYLFYATPYLVVLRETDLVSAARASFALALGGGPYLFFALGFAGFVFLSSVFVTAVVANFGVVGIALGVVVVAPVGLAANVTTMRFVADIDVQSPSLGTWKDEATDPNFDET